MSLLTNYEELSQAQELGIFKEVLDETLKPILISLDEKFFKIHMDINDVEIKLCSLKNDLRQQIEDLGMKHQTDIVESNEVHSAYYHNLLKELSELSSDVESIKLNLNK